MKPSKKWLGYENSNNFAVYSIAAMIAVGLAYSIRHLLNLPIYIFHLNWLPLLSVFFAIIIAEQLEDILEKKLGYAPITEFVRTKIIKFRRTHNFQQIRRDNLKSIFWPVGLMCAALAFPDTDSFTPEHYSFFYLYGMLLGNTHTQAGVTWVLTGIIAIAIRAGITVYLRKENLMDN